MEKLRGLWGLFMTWIGLTEAMHCEEDPNEVEENKNEKGGVIDDREVRGDDVLDIIDVIHDINVEMQQEQMDLGCLKCPGSAMSSVSFQAINTPIVQP